MGTVAREHPTSRPTSRFVPLAQASEATGVVVVIDVLRAFTTAAVALSRGAREIVLTETVEGALELRERLGDCLLLGEVDGSRPDGFDLSNSPTELAMSDVAGRTLVQRTTAGTAGAVAIGAADAVIAASFVCASATVRWLRDHAADEITFVITGAHGDLDGDEDRACADYLAACLAGQRPDVRPFLDRVVRSDAGRRFLPEGPPQYPPEDLELATELDHHDVAMPVVRESDLVVLRPDRPSSRRPN